jgi:hypothetical protein
LIQHPAIHRGNAFAVSPDAATGSPLANAAVVSSANSAGFKKDFVTSPPRAEKSQHSGDRDPKATR